MTKKLILPITLLITLLTFSCALPADIEGKPKVITGNISYVAVTGSVGSEFSVSPSKNIMPFMATVKYTITPDLPTGLTFHSNIGEITGSSDRVYSSRYYVVTVSGTGKYAGSVQSKLFPISIDSDVLNPVDISVDSSIRYEDILGARGTDLVRNPSKSILPSTAIVRYSIFPDLPTGLTFNPDTGEIRGTLAVRPVSIDHTVMVIAVEPYLGSVSSNRFVITIVDDKNINGFTLYYSDILDVVGTGLSIPPTSTIPSEAAVTYSIDPSILPDGLLFDSLTGRIYGTPKIRDLASRYTVRATGIENYTGTVDSNSFVIAISKTQAIDISAYSISYESSSTPVGKDVSLAQTGISSRTTVLYTIEPAMLPDGVTFNSGNGVISISGTPGAVLSPTFFRVTAYGKDNYTGVVVSDFFTIEVTRIMIIGTISYSDFNGLAYSTVSITPTINTIRPFIAVASFMYSISSGSLPEGLTLNDDGVIFGTPTEKGRFVLKVTATANGHYEGIVESDEFTINVR